MYSYDEILAFLPSKQKQVLVEAIRKRLLEIERFFERDLASFLKSTSFKQTDFSHGTQGQYSFTLKIA